jgi:ADP-dependent NAD(P)H-hydrate dehydratase / NAD(P)H-hydrate epimerase
MRRIASAAEMRELDRRAVTQAGIPSLLLMENAGAETVREILAAFPVSAGRRVAVLCGRGNNGGDGFVVARRLHGRGISVRTFLAARRDEVQGDARVNLEILEKLGIPPVEIGSASDLPALGDALHSADLVVDALLGTGARGAARGLLAEIIDLVNQAGKPVAAVDIPSGLGADLPDPLGPAIRASLTVTFAHLKPSLVFFPAAGYAGLVRVVDIGIPGSLDPEGPPDLALLEPSDVAPAFPARNPAAHKGSFGHVLVIAGSVGKTGAAALAALAAQRSGAGLVTLAVPASLNPILEVKLTEVMTVPLPETDGRTIGLDALETIVRLAEGKAVVAIGPGLGTHPATQQLVRLLLARLRLPVVVDADALNALVGESESLARAAGPLVLTPHPGECARLLNVPRAEVLADRIRLARETAVRFRLTLVLKLARTLVADPSGRLAVVPTGNPGMATGGTGDVLTGLIAGLIAQGLAPAESARAGTYLHGLAGDLAARRLGQEAMLAGDLLESIPEAIRQVKGSGATGEASDQRMGDRI